MFKVLIIQTAFIGDVILATALAESVHKGYPDAEIHFAVRSDCAVLFKNHPYVTRVYSLNKKEKYTSLWNLLRDVRKEKFDLLLNLGRFGSSGIISLMAKAKTKLGFRKNFFSFAYDAKFKHEFKDNWHEINRNQVLLSHYKEFALTKPRLYPSESDYDKIKEYQNGSYYCIAPSSVWFTKQMPKEKWIELCDFLDNKGTIYLLGGPADKDLCEEIKTTSKNTRITNLCGKINLLQSAALMQHAEMNYVNDSAPLHLCSAMNAPTTAFYCSTVPKFGFGPLSNKQRIVEITEELDCRPCGLHGKKECPKIHFKCGYNIDIGKLA